MNWIAKKISVGQITLYVILILASLSMILPFLHVISVSVSSRISVEAEKVLLWPVDFTWDSYKYVFSKKDLMRSFGVNTFITVVGTLNSMFFTVLLAYSLAKREFLIRKQVMLLVLFTMIFHAPIVPYFLTVKAMGLMNSVWALIIPLTINAFNLILVRVFFMQIPKELEEAATIDGCNDLSVLFRVFLPVSKPVLATVGLFYAVAFWNIFYHALLFIYDKRLEPLQVKIRNYFATPEAMMMDNFLTVNYNIQTLQMATVMVATLPILILYPFLQKYFIHGAMLGSVKE